MTSDLYTFKGGFINDHLDRLYQYDQQEEVYRHVDIEDATVICHRFTKSSSSFLITPRAVQELIEDAYHQYEFSEEAIRRSARACINTMRRTLGDRFQRPAGACWVKSSEGY
jgi:hypothetical protein